MAELLDALAVLAVAYPREHGRYTAAQSETWESLLQDADPDAVLRAVRQLAATSKWAPTIADIREAAGVVDPATAARRAAAARAAERHAEWVSEQDRLATEEARERLRAAGVDPDSIGPGDVDSLVKGIGH